MKAKTATAIKAALSKKRSGFVLATVMISMTAIIVLTSVLFLLLQVDRLDLQEAEAWLERERWISQVAQQLENGESPDNLKSFNKYKCHCLPDGTGSNRLVCYLSAADSLSDAQNDYIVRIELVKNTDSEGETGTDASTGYTIVLWQRNY